ncbi:MAG: tetratricopeptide repeat protein [Taibaiella sp.]|jgi:tetratricopeptide (TPR) repeat protein
MLKYLVITSVVIMFFSSCGNNTTSDDNPAYHNPAVQPYTDSIAMNREHAEYYYRRAEALTEINNDSLALIDVQQAISLDKNNAQYTFTAGYLQLQLGQAKEAIKTLKHNLEQMPGNVNTRMLLSKAYLADAKIEAAQEQINKILAAAPRHPGALMILADIKAAQKDTVATINILREIITTDAGNYDAAYQLGDWYKATNNPAAVTQYQYTFSLDTTDANPLFEIGDYYERQNQLEKAKEAFIYCIEEDRDFTNAYIHLGKIYLQEKATEKALRHFNLAINTMPNNAEAYYYKGLCFEKMQQADSAAVAFRQALVFDRNMKEAADALYQLKK